MTTNTATTRQNLHSQVHDALRETVAHLCADDRERFDVEAALVAIMAGEVEPDDNDGLIPADDVARRLAFGAVMSDGPWWIPA